MLPNEQWVVFYGAISVITFVASISLTGAAFYFKRMESHFDQMHKMSNQMIIINHENSEQNRKLAHIEILLQELKLGQLGKVLEPLSHLAKLKIEAEKNEEHP